MEACFFWHWEWKLMNASFQLVLIGGFVNSWRNVVFVLLLKPFDKAQINTEIILIEQLSRR